jgi:hypothetical protein
VRAGLVLNLDSDGRLFYHVFSERAKCLFNPIDAVSEPVPTDKEVEELEHRRHLEHMAEIVIDETQ